MRHELPEEKVQYLKSLCGEYNVMSTQDREGKNNYLLGHKNQFATELLSEKLFSWGIKGASGDKKFVSNHSGGSEYQVILTDDDFIGLTHNVRNYNRNNSEFGIEKTASLSLITLLEEYKDNAGQKLFGGFVVAKMEDGNLLVKHGQKEVADNLAKKLFDNGIVGGGGEKKFVNDFSKDGMSGVIITPINIKSLFDKPMTRDSGMSPLSSAKCGYLQEGGVVAGRGR